MLFDFKVNSNLADVIFGTKKGIYLITSGELCFAPLNSHWSFAHAIQSRSSEKQRDSL